MNSIIELSKIFSLAESIEYVNGSVVSKTIIKKTTGTVTLFAFDKGEGLSEHSSPYEAFIQIVDGESEIKIGEKNFSLQTHQSIILPANVPHSLKANERFKMILIMIKS